MTIFTHATVGTNDLEKARAFYDAVLGALGYSRTVDMPAATIWGKDGSAEFFVMTPADGGPATVGNGSTLGFVAPDGAAVDAFHAAALAHGGVCEGPPGPRPWSPGKRACYVRDADGHKLSAYGPE